MNNKGSIKSISGNAGKATSRVSVDVQEKEVKVGDTDSWRGMVATFIASQDVREYP